MPIEFHELQIPPTTPEPDAEPAGLSRVTAPPFEPVVPDQQALPAPAPEDPREAASLQFVGGVANLFVTVDPTLTERFAARFEGPQPEVSELGSEITIRYHGGPVMWGRTEAYVRLRPDLAWTLRVRGGVSRADIDVRDLDLRAFEIAGGVSRMELALGEAHGTVPVRVSGGASRLDISRPATVPARVDINGGASRLTVDDQMLGAIGGRTRLQSGSFESARDRLEVEVRGGASRLSVRPR